MPNQTLLEIAKLPTAENSVIHLHATDNVAIARVPLSGRGAELKVDGQTLTAREPIPAGHKIALAAFRGESCGAMARSSAAPGKPSSRAITCTRTTWPSRSCTSITNSRPAKLRCPRAGPVHLSRISARGWLGGHAQLYRGGGGQQLRRAHRRIDRAQLRRRIAAGQRGWRGGLPARGRLRPHHRPRHRAASPHAGRGAWRTPTFPPR
jgi:hypothetical protein